MTIARAIPALLACLGFIACVSGGAPPSRPKVHGCEVSVAQGTVRFTVRYAWARPMPDSLLVIASIRRPGGDEVVRVHARRGDRAVIGGSGQELRGPDGWVQTRTAEGGTVEFAIPERAPGSYDLSGLEARAHLVLQVERGEGAIPLGELDTGKLVL